MASTCSHACILIVPLFISALLLIRISPSAAQPGFISIDCGGPEPFISVANISWVTDDQYITTGKAAEVNNSADVSTTRQTVRYFPEKIPKSCYELTPVQEGRGYIVRAYFYYGNFDGKDSMPQFSFIVDATVMVNLVANNGYYEMYVPAKSDIISVCLARDVPSLTGDPFISTLELRTLPHNTTYDTVALSQGYGLFNVYSVDLGTNYSYFFRYPNDTLDRLWWSDEVPANSTVSTTHEIVVSQEKNPDLGPPMMLQTAITGTNLSYSINGLSSSRKYLLTMHFSEFSPNVTGSGQRVFDIYSNVWQQGSQPWAANVDIYNLSGGQFMGLELYGAQPVTPVNNSIVISFRSSPNSSHGPIISGVQAFLLTNDPLSNLTSADDGRTIRDIRDYYGINGSFGDPCMPEKFTWTWINCELNEGLPRIIAISLSRWALRGVVYSQFDKLSALTEIHLDGNNLTGMIPEFNSLSNLEVLDLSKNQLTGPIPDFASLKKLQILNLVNNRLSGSIPATLSSLSSLKELYLANNQLEGEIPPSLLAKFKAGTLNFTYGGNTKLTCNGESCDLFMAPPAPPPLVVSSPPRLPIVPSPNYATIKTTSILPVYVILISLLIVQAF
ncbi:hypothetical protein L7F22_027849 [Adiantum nelumboides]|nr:hypothetical protein [Adiantum nelumboides]